MNSQLDIKDSNKDSHPHTGADTVVASLLHQDVEIVFGMQGGSIMPVYDSLYRAGAPRHIMVGHEQGAAHMADGYARATGKPGVVLTTSGPGATNLVTGLANAMMDSIPLVAITGQVTSNLLGNDAFQEADMWGITMPVTKHNYQVIDTEELPDVFAEAFYVAMSGRPGPVLIDLPKDVAQMECPSSHAPPRVPEGYWTPYQPNMQRLSEALDVLRQAKKPVILAGGGVVQGDAAAELKRFAERLKIPVTSTLMGLGNFPADHELSLGMPGMHGTGYANLALYHADAILVLGSRLDDRITGQVDRFCPNARLIHVDIDASEINKIVTCVVPVVGHAKPVLKAMLKMIDEWQAMPDYAEWLKQIADWKKEYAMVYPRRDGVTPPQEVIEMIGRILDEEATIVTGVGQHQMYTAQYYPFRRPRSLITSGGLGTMGFGLPAALGAKLGAPERDVVCIDGDGSFLMNIQELATAVRYNIGVVIVILNNSYLGMVRQWQDMFLDGRRSETLLSGVPYDQVAKAFGGLGRRVERPEEVSGALEWALAQCRKENLPVVLDVQVDPEAMVLPMVPPGGANADFVPCQGGEACHDRA
jgi:acetolactate synthase-1/2/3 large subunit